MLILKPVTVDAAARVANWLWLMINVILFFTITTTLHSSCDCLVTVNVNAEITVVFQTNPTSPSEEASNRRASCDDVQPPEVADPLTNGSDVTRLVPPPPPAHSSTPSGKHRVTSDVKSRRELYDIESGDSDKENTLSSAPDPVFMFHHTPSVVAMERIFAQQRLPSYVKPNGYISPLRCPRYLMTSSLVC